MMTMTVMKRKVVRVDDGRGWVYELWKVEGGR